MSVNYYTKIGPYIKVYNPKVDSEEAYYSCPNILCGNHRQHLCTKFCSKCGNEIKLTSFPCKKAIQIDVYEEFKDKLAEVCTEYKPHKQDDYLFFVPNQGKHGIQLDGENTAEVELNETTLVDQYGRFIVEYEKEINRLKEIFGEENVSVKWGVLGWHS